MDTNITKTGQKNVLKKMVKKAQSPSPVLKSGLDAVAKPKVSKMVSTVKDSVSPTRFKSMSSAVEGKKEPPSPFKLAKQGAQSIIRKTVQGAKGVNKFLKDTFSAPGAYAEAQSKTDDANRQSAIDDYINSGGSGDEAYKIFGKK